MTSLAVEAIGVCRTFGQREVLGDVRFHVARGEVLCLLGHNGAGKSTLVKILSTALPPSAGTARVDGFDVIRQARQVRSRIGLTGQFASIDENLTGRDNLILVARLFGAGRRAARERADQLLEAFGLTHVAGARARTLSGGTRRRLDIASSFVSGPSVLFLDEPSTGLDLVSRNAMWDLIRSTVADGATVLLTTQYLEEAEQLADRIVLLAEGRVVANGAVDELKRRVGSGAVTVTLAACAQKSVALAGVRRHLGCHATFRAGTLSVALGDGVGVVEVIRALDAAGVGVEDVAVVRPTLDDVYLSHIQPQSRGGNHVGHRVGV